ncbi:MAG: lysophospholipid acyltransferase family protein [Candidatus Electrothrix sp. GW3-4]|uniref:lysophospholipid acyltransferase family protein n=1 Tax=Candidatus Electrothrix sp. GW3-4 TaxID=3126740 RepID=UPI0030CC2523
MSTSDFLYKASLAVVPRLYVSLTALWFGTCPVQIRGQENLDKVLEQGAAVVPFWHYSVFYMLYHLRQYPGVAMVSASKDGEYIARVAGLLGFETVRGSANRFGVRALKGMVDHVKQGKNAGIVADGSQGPALKMQPGAIMLAAKSGSPIMPVVWATKRYKAFNSWDHSVIPKPFSPLILQYGDLIYVEPKLTSVRVEEYRQQVETAMYRMYQDLWQEFGRDGHV